MNRLLLSLALLIAAAPLAAVNVIPGEWRFLGPDGGWVQELIAAPANPRVMYAVSLGTLYRSRDGGASWNRVSDASQVAVDAVNPSLLYAPGLGRSFDGGSSWLSLPGPAVIESYVAHPRFAGTVFALADVGLFRSPNAGVSWRRLQTGLPAIYRADRLVIDPFAPRRLYLVLQEIAAAAPRLYKSLDGGTTWQRDRQWSAGRQAGPGDRHPPAHLAGPLRLHAGGRLQEHRRRPELGGHRPFGGCPGHHPIPGGPARPAHRPLRREQQRPVPQPGRRRDLDMAAGGSRHPIAPLPPAGPLRHLPPARPAGRHLQEHGRRALLDLRQPGHPLASGERDPLR